MTAAPVTLWEPQPKAQALIDRLLAKLLKKQALAAELQQQMRERAGVRLVDCLDFLTVSPDATLEAELREAGFEGDANRLTHPGGIFPPVRLMDGPEAVGVKVDRADDFAATHQITTPVTGEPGARFRTVVHTDPDTGIQLWGVERHGWADFTTSGDTPQAIRLAAQWLERFRVRTRDGDTDDVLFASTLQLIGEAQRDLPEDWVCDLFFQAERDFWMRRNTAAQAQYLRQQRVGIGWANHDHHTYRCSRENIHRLVAVLEKLGLFCRERFYPGEDAGWGAQVLEHAVTHIVVFADVDMSPEEIRTDFPHLGLEPRQDLKTVGLWCKLHGDSMLAAGMHHLECMFAFDEVRDQLQAEAGIGMMRPFTDFDYLKQQFTEGQRWDVDAKRVQKLLDAGQITDEEAKTFLAQGAIGSHLENLERNDGFKGFNQTGITQIIDETDPRHKLALAGSV